MGSYRIRRGGAAAAVPALVPGHDPRGVRRGLQHQPAAENRRRSPAQAGRARPDDPGGSRALPDVDSRAAADAAGASRHRGGRLGDSRRRRRCRDSGRPSIWKQAVALEPQQERCGQCGAGHRRRGGGSIPVLVVPPRDHSTAVLVVLDRCADRGGGRRRGGGDGADQAGRQRLRAVDGGGRAVGGFDRQRGSRRRDDLDVAGDAGPGGCGKRRRGVRRLHGSHRVRVGCRGWRDHRHGDIRQRRVAGMDLAARLLSVCRRHLADGTAPQDAAGHR